jgi:hypothetical protein
MVPAVKVLPVDVSVSEKNAVVPPINTLAVMAITIRLKTILFIILF